MEYSERVLELILEAIDQVNEDSGPDKAIERSPESVLIGPASNVDSLTFVNLAAVVEENIEATLKEKISMIDIIFAGKKRDWTVLDLAKSISQHVNHVAVDERLRETGT